MKILRVLPLSFMVLMSSCSLEPGNTMYSNVVIPFDERIVPETGIINQPVTIYASAFAETACWSNIHFVLTRKNDFELEMWALADFSSNGVCPEMLVESDTTVTFTPDRTGNQVITFWMAPAFYERDTVIISAAPGKK